MSQMGRMETRSQMRDGQMREGMYQTEHWLAWLMALTALVLGAIGVLRGFGVLGDVAEQVGAGEQATGLLTGTGEFWDAVVWLLPAISAAFLAHALHLTEHHRMPDMSAEMDTGSMRSKAKTQTGLYRFEHVLAYLMALAAIVAGVLCLLVGFGIFSDTHTQFDGILWGFLSIVYGTLTVMLHTLRQHQMVADEDYLVSMVEQRVRSGIAYGGQPGTGAPEPERR